MKTIVTVIASEFSVAQSAITSIKQFFVDKALEVKGPNKIKSEYGPRPCMDSRIKSLSRSEIVKLARMRLVVEGFISNDTMTEFDKIALPSTCRLEFKVET